MINKVTDSQIAYYLGEDGNLRKINVNDAKEYLENGFKFSPVACGNYYTVI